MQKVTMEPLRVLMLFTNMNRGGAESMVMSYFRHINRSKVVFDFLVHRKERGAYEDEIESLGGHIYRMRPFHPLSFHQYKKDIRLFFDEHPEFKVVHGHCSELGYFVYQEANRRHLPVIIAHAHNAHALFDLKWPFRTWFKHRMRRYLTHGFTCGEDASRWLFGNKLAASAILQRNAIDTQLYHYHEENRQELRERIGIEDETLLIGHVGRFNRQKNHDFIVKVFSEVVKQYPNTRLLLVGQGELESQVREQVERLGLSEQVIFAGIRGDVPQLLQAMDVMLFPSFMEGLSLSMVEAQCAGLPILASDTIPSEVAMTDLVTFKSLSESPCDWAVALLEICQRSISREQYSEQIASAGYDIRANARWLQEFYLSAVKQS